MAFDDEEMRTEDGRSYVKLGREYLELEARLLVESKIDAEKYPTPSRMAKILGVSMEEVLELASFAKDGLGEYEALRIQAEVGQYINPDGTPLQQFWGM